MPCDSLPLFLSNPILQSEPRSKLLRHSQPRYLGSHKEPSAAGRAEQGAGQWCSCDVYGLYHKKVGKRYISPPFLLPKMLANVVSHPKTVFNKKPFWHVWKKLKERRKTHRWILCLSVSVWPVCPPAGCGRPGWAGAQKWSLKLLPVWPWEREWAGRPTAGAAEQGGRVSEHDRQRREREREERGTAPSYPPPWPPALPSSTLQTPSPWPPRMQIPGLRPKYRNSKSVQIAGTTTHRFTHTCPHIFLPSYLVPQHTWFHLN